MFYKIRSEFHRFQGFCYIENYLVPRRILLEKLQLRMTTSVFLLVLHGPNLTKTRSILKHKLRTLQYLRAHQIPVYFAVHGLADVSVT